jgi:hypothetical protein
MVFHYDQKHNRLIGLSVGRETSRRHEQGDREPIHPCFTLGEKFHKISSLLRSSCGAMCQGKEKNNFNLWKTNIPQGI